MRLGTVKAACKVIGGDKPIHPATYYRGVKLGIYSAPFHPTPNTSRVDLDKLAEEIRERAAAEAASRAVLSNPQK